MADRHLKRTVCFGGETPGSAGRYLRAEIPARAVRPWWSSSVSMYALTPQTPKEIRKDPRIRGWNGPGSKIIPPASVVTLRIMDNVVIDPRTGWSGEWSPGSMAEDIQRAREAGQIVLYDIDDDIWHIPEWSPAARAMHKIVPTVRAMDLEVIDANIRAGDGVIVSTPYLYDVVFRQFQAHHWPNPVPIFLQRPGIDPAAYASRKVNDLWIKPERPLRVGWMGSMSHHLPHLQWVADALDVLPKYGAEFVHMGHILGDGSHRSLRDLPCRWTQLPWGDIDTVPGKLAQVDVGIIPRLPGDSFFEGQSVSSGLQYAAAGVPFLVSPTAEYERLEHLGAGRVCRTISDWRQGLSDLLEYEDTRRYESDRARECVAESFGLKATGRRYVEMLEGLIG